MNKVTGTQDERDLRWLITAMLRVGKRRFGHHKFEIGGQMVRCTPTDAENIVRFEVSCAPDLDAWLAVRIPDGARPEPLAELTRFDGGVDIVDTPPFGYTTLPLFFESMREFETFTGMRLPQHDPRCFQYWMAVYGTTIPGTVISDLAAFRSLFTVARLTLKDTP